MGTWSLTVTTTGQIGSNNSPSRQGVNTQYAKQHSVKGDRSHTDGRKANFCMVTCIQLLAWWYRSLQATLSQEENRWSLGTKWFGRKASVQVRLLNGSNGIQLLEIQVPMISAHLPAHNPSSVTDQLTMKPLSKMEEKVVELVQESFLNQRALRLSLKNLGRKGVGIQTPQHRCDSQQAG